MSFNPCYVGLWSVRDYSLATFQEQKSFNPCYVGLWSVRFVADPEDGENTMFQSLLCWIMVCKEGQPREGQPREGVSILVMLDYGL